MLDLEKIPNINLFSASVVIEELYRNGVEYICLASGSRSAPLTLAAAQHPKIKTFIHFDERTLGFHALGVASVTGKPVAVITTSGSAVANLFPSIIEISKKKLPVVFLTADRPEELQNCGAHQTIDHQKGIFGQFVRQSFELPCPQADFSVNDVLKIVDDALNISMQDVKGPVHINCPFREPLDLSRDNLDLTHYIKSVSHWMISGKPFNVRFRQMQQDDLANYDFRSIEDSKVGIIAVGKTKSEEERLEILRFARHLGWPIFPDITSGFRLGCDHENVIHYFDQLLQIHPDLIQPECVIQIGGRMTSKRWLQFLEKIQLKNYFMVLRHSKKHDPLGNVTLQIQSSVKSFVNAALTQVDWKDSRDSLERLKELNLKFDQTIEEKFSGQFSEETVCRLISKMIPQNHHLFLGNSLPVRHFDMFADFKSENVFVHGNRGASGIDGNISTATGVIQGSDQPLTAVVGDLTFMYDMNALTMLSNLKKPMVLVVLNNQGGKIFSKLPVAKNNPHFEEFFTTPHQYTFRELAKQFDLKYARIDSEEQFKADYSKTLKQNQSTILEVKV